MKSVKTNRVSLLSLGLDAAIWWFTPFREYPHPDCLAPPAFILSRVDRQETAAPQDVDAILEKPGAREKDSETELDYLDGEHATWAYAWWVLRMGVTISAVVAVRLALGIEPL